MVQGIPQLTASCWARCRGASNNQLCISMIQWRWSCSAHSKEFVVRIVWLNEYAVILEMTLTNLLLSASWSVCKMLGGHRHLAEAVAEPSGELPLPVTIATVIACLRKLGQHIAMFSEVVKLLELFLLLPVTSAMAERSFSGFRRLKTLTRTCMSQELLNSLAILHVHSKHLTCQLDVINAAKEFVARSPHRLSTFDSFA